MPEMEVYGYELCQPGVDVSRAAAAKFNIDVKFEQLNYLNMESGGALFPPADVSFTCYSLEQLPDGVDAALSNIQSLSRMGSLHLEPVTDNYPLTFRGLIGRLDHWKVGYLRGLDAAARRLPGIAVSWERIKRAHNPLMFPSMYVLKKTTL